MFEVDLRTRVDVKSARNNFCILNESAIKERKKSERKKKYHQGNFENDLYNGFGVHTYSKESTNQYYEGHWKNAKKSGKGKLVWKNGSKYEGNFENGDFNGFGIYTFSKEDAEDYYEVHWKENKRSGKGKLVFKDGTKQEGIFENGWLKH